MSDDLTIPNSGYRGSRAGRYGTGPSRGRPGMDPDTRRLMIFAGGLGGLLVLLVAASALVGRHSNDIPVVMADSRPIREKPLKAGGMKIDGAENDVFSGLSDAADAKLAPAAENPDTKAFRAVKTPPAAPADITPAFPAGVAKLPPPQPAPAAQSAQVAQSAQAAKQAVIAQVAKPAPMAKPAQAAKSDAPAAETNPAPSGRVTMVQLAALASEEAAHTEWQLLSKRMPDLLHGRQPSYSRTERDGRTFWRVRTSGFADVAQARTFCEHVRAKAGACSVAEF